MKDVLFNGDVMVEVQGDEALELVDRGEVCAKFQLIGFDNPKIFMNEHRSAGVRAIELALNSGKLDLFAPEFNQPANIIVKRNKNESITVDLFETDNQRPSYMLWAAIGIADDVPIYKYLLYEIGELPNGTYTFFSIYERSKSFVEEGSLLPESSFFGWT